jgi:hypothetical protein
MYMAHTTRNYRILRPQQFYFYFAFIHSKNTTKTHAINTQVSRCYLLFVVWRIVGVVIYLAASINLANGLAVGAQTRDRKCYISDLFVWQIWYFHTETDEVSKKILRYNAA